MLKELQDTHDDERLSNLCDKALHLLEDLPTIDISKREGRTIAVQLYTSGIALWNKTVALKSAGAVTTSLNAQSE